LRQHPSRPLPSSALPSASYSFSRIGCPTISSIACWFSWGKTLRKLDGNPVTIMQCFRVVVSRCLYSPCVQYTPRDYDQAQTTWTYRYESEVGNGVSGMNIDRTLKWARPVVTRAAENSCAKRLIGVICPLLPLSLLVSTYQSEGWLGSGGADRIVRLIQKDPRLCGASRPLSNDSELIGAKQSHEKTGRHLE
jgi:hypothetical protein